MVKFTDRPTGDMLLLLIAGTVCSVVMVSTLAVLVAEVAHPEADTSGAAKTVGDALSALIALLAGFLAGRSGRIAVGSEKPGTDTENGTTRGGQ